MDVLAKLTKDYDEDRLSLDIQQCRVLIDYLLAENDKLRDENNSVWSINSDLEYELEMTRDELIQCKKENLDFADCWLHKDKLRELFKEVEEAKEKFRIFTEKYKIIKENYEDYLFSMKEEDLPNVKDFCILSNYIQKLEEDNRFLLARGDIDTYRRLKDDYIPKQKILDKIEEWDKPLKWANADDHYYAIRMLQDLLNKEE